MSPLSGLENSALMSPRVVIGAGEPNRLAALVCEFTLLKHCPEVEVIHTYHRPFIPGLDNTLHRDRWDDPCQWVPTKHPLGTMFSLCRHMVPEICGFEGQAIYLDADMLLFDSIAKLWNMPMGMAKILRLKGGQFSVIKMDCEGLKDYTVHRLLVKDRYSYRDLMQGRYLPPQMVWARIPDVWNHTDRFVKGETKLLHYTRMQTQPWAIPGHKFGGLWFDALAEALKEGFLTMALVESQIKPQNIKTTWPAAVWPQAHVMEELKKRL